MFWRLELATVWQLNQVAKNVCLAEIGAVFKSFSVFPRTFVTVHLLSKLSPSQTLRESIFKISLVLHFLSKSSRKGMGFDFSISFYLFHGYFYYRLDCYCVRNISLFVWWVWLVMFAIVLICFHVEWSQCAFSLFWYLPVVETENLLLNGFGTYLSCSFHLLECWCWISVLGYWVFMIT